MSRKPTGGDNAHILRVLQGDQWARAVPLAKPSRPVGSARGDVAHRNRRPDWPRKDSLSRNCGVVACVTGRPPTERTYRTHPRLVGGQPAHLGGLDRRTRQLHCTGAPRTGIHRRRHVVKSDSCACRRTLTFTMAGCGSKASRRDYPARRHRVAVAEGSLTTHGYPVYPPDVRLSFALSRLWVQSVGGRRGDGGHGQPRSPRRGPSCTAPESPHHRLGGLQSASAERARRGTHMAASRCINGDRRLQRRRAVRPRRGRSYAPSSPSTAGRPKARACEGRQTRVSESLGGHDHSTPR